MRTILLELFVNFCILFTFAMLMYWFARQQRLPLSMYLSQYRGLSIGLLASVFGIVLMLKSLNIGSSIVIDGRMAVVALSGLFGGPVAPILSGVIIGTFRIFMNDVTMNSVIAGINTIVIGIVIGIASIKRPITFRNAWKYFLYTTVQTCAVIVSLSWTTGFVAGRGALFAFYALISFAVVYLTLKKMDQLSNEIDRIQQYSVTDYLTGLANNRKFQELYFQWIKSKPSFYLAIIDIDRFKRINDTYGHPIGDEVLVELARRLQIQSEKFGGEVARIGGEEFGALLPASTHKEAFELAEQLRTAVNTNYFILPEGLELPITVSIGVAGFPLDAQSMTDLYKLADEKLYDAKLNGRNRVCVTAEPTRETNQEKREVF